MISRMFIVLFCVFVAISVWVPSEGKRIKDAEKVMDCFDIGGRPYKIEGTIKCTSVVKSDGRS